MQCMPRNRILALACTMASAFLLRPTQEPFAVLIRNGLVVDDSGYNGFVADIGRQGDGQIEALRSGKGSETFPSATMTIRHRGLGPAARPSIWPRRAACRVGGVTSVSSLAWSIEKVLKR